MKSKRFKNLIISDEAVLAQLAEENQLPRYVECHAGNFKSFMQSAKSAKEKGGKRICKGYATTETIDWVDDQVTMDAMKDARDHLLQPGTNTMFFNHDTDEAIGKVLKTALDKKGLFIECLISNAKDVDDIWTKIKEGILSNFSIRFIPVKVEVEKDEKGNIVAFKILKMRLLEVSVVGLPCNKDANITEVIGKSMKLLSHKRSKTMTSKERKQTITGAVKELLPELVAEIVEAQVGEALKGVTDSIKALGEQISGKKKTTEKTAMELLADSVKALSDKIDGKTKATEDEEEGEDEEVEVKAKNKKVEVKVEKKAKSKQVEEDEEDEEEKPVVKAKKKAKTVETEEGEEDEEFKLLSPDGFKTTDDVNTCKSVLLYMDSTEKYAALSKEGKDKVKSLYFKMQQEIKSR